MSMVRRARDFAANQRCCAMKVLRGPSPAPARKSTTCAGLERDIFVAIEHRLLRGGLEAEPVVSVWRHADEVGPVVYSREACLAQHLDGCVPLPGAEIELDGLGGVGKVGDRQHRFPAELQ